MKSLLIVTAVAEAATGLALLGLPLLVASLLLGAPLDTPAALVVARVTGAALLSLSVACWLARNDVQSRAARGLVNGLLLYNTVVVAVLVHAGVVSRLSGMGLWPTVVLHVALAAWCIACLRTGASASDA
jgi:hypothetical protein